MCRQRWLPSRAVDRPTILHTWFSVLLVFLWGTPALACVTSTAVSSHLICTFFFCLTGCLRAQGQMAVTRSSQNKCLRQGRCPTISSRASLPHQLCLLHTVTHTSRLTVSPSICSEIHHASSDLGGDGGGWLGGRHQNWWRFPPEHNRRKFYSSHVLTSRSCKGV